jgi:hypothetical protein
MSVVSQNATLPVAFSYNDSLASVRDAVFSRGVRADARLLDAFTFKQCGVSFKKRGAVSRRGSFHGGGPVRLCHRRPHPQATKLSLP